jgi:hypothetical protein
MKNHTAPFRYVPASETDIRVTFERERNRLAELARQSAAAAPASPGGDAHEASRGRGSLHPDKE